MPGGPQVSAVALGLLSAATMGAADFSGGLATRRISFAVVIAVSHACGLVLLAALAIGTGAPAPSVTDVLWALGAGLSVLIGLSGLYRAMSIGRIGLVAPVSGVLAAALPVALTLFTRGVPSGSQVAGFALGMAGIWLISRSKDERGGMAGLRLALLAGLAFGTFFVLLARAQTSSVLWPLVSARAASGLAATALALRHGYRSLATARPLLWLLVLTGVLDVGGNAFFLLAAQFGRLDIAAVVSSLYPASTILLARVILRERMNSAQVTGIVAALAAIVLIATG
jgi:drug/metabolite transporter (DMT)-like permease